VLIESHQSVRPLLLLLPAQTLWPCAESVKQLQHRNLGMANLHTTARISILVAISSVKKILHVISIQTIVIVRIRSAEGIPTQILLWHANI
jgi:hypothetical protein